MSLEKLKAEAVKLRQNIDAVYEAGKQSEYDRFWDARQQNGTRTDYRGFYAGTAWTPEFVLPKYFIKPNRATYMFWYFRPLSTQETFDMTELCKMIDFSECTVLQSTFNNAYIKNIVVDASNATSLYECFRAGDGGLCDNITLTVTEKCTDYTYAFHYQIGLKDLTFTDGSVIAAAISFSMSKSLSDESVQSIINALKDLTGGTAQKVTFHADVKNKLTEDQILQILAKNWQLV